MKYLKKYKLFEDNSSDELEHEIDELCKGNLAYLLDDGGFTYNVSSEDDYTVLELDYFDEDSDMVGFDWNFLKDDIIPFIYVLNEKYNLMDIQFYCHDGTEHPRLDDILNDPDFYSEGISAIHFVLKNKQ